MFAQKFLSSLKRDKPLDYFLRKNKKVRVRKVNPDLIGVDVVAEQVKQMLTDSDQQLILMVRG